ncbi:MAG TPA: DNA repair protein RecN [Actinomycetes bacterium]|nr:DNA repair protein RecN [Actinomycetes bacterium]
MLLDLHITDLGVIDDAHLEVARGLNVLTGETGAGKTMVVDALALLLGERAVPGTVRAGRPAALAEARLALAGEQAAAEALEKAGFASADGEVVVARQVSTEGRNRVQVQGRMATVAALTEVTRLLVEVHGQHDFQGLLRPAVQRDLLDRFAGARALELRAAFGRAWQRLRAVTAELDALVTRAHERAREADVLRYQLGEIDAGEVREGEQAELEAEAERLRHAEALREASATAHQALAGTDDEGGAATALGLAARVLGGQGGHDPALAELARRADGLAADLADLASSLRAYAEAVQTDPARLAEVHERLALLRDLERKYGDDEAAILAFAQVARARLADLEGGVVRSEALEAEAAALRGELAEVGGALTRARRDAAERLGAAVQRELAELSMPGARFGIRVEPEEPGGPDGLDRIELELAANPGAPPRPLAKAASGGELSRVMLALRVVLAGVDRMPTLVFDEVDAGIGGRTAAAVGRRLAALAHHHQVLVVTHLPQIAAFADRHFVVEKQVAGDDTRTEVRPLDDAARLTELSRMLSGMAESGLAQAHAEELLAAATATKAAGRDAPGTPG